MKRKPYLAVRMSEKLSDHANKDDFSFETYRNKDGYLSLSEETNVEEAGPVGLEGCGEELLQANAIPKWKISVKRRYKRRVVLRCGRIKKTSRSQIQS